MWFFLNILIYFIVINNVSLCFRYLYSLFVIGHHECEILGRGLGTSECENLSRKCEKNPGHEKFISTKDFKDNYLPKIKTKKHRDMFRAVLDLTVRLRVRWTSPGRPCNDVMQDYRGTDRLRLGTGLITFVSDPVLDKPCPCIECKGEITRKFWRLDVRTAHHVVYNTEEAKSTKVDLFYDSDKLGGRMQTVKGLEVEQSDPDIDTCYMMCVTHDEALGEWIESALRSKLDVSGEPLDLSGLDLLPSCDTGRYPTLIVSHPHGQSKKITVGQGRHAEPPLAEYNTATCPGSSGATVFWFHPDETCRRFNLWFPSVHSGSSISTSTQSRGKHNVFRRFLQKLSRREAAQEQINYGHYLILL